LPGSRGNERNDFQEKDRCNRQGQLIINGEIHPFTCRERVAYQSARQVCNAYARNCGLQQGVGLVIKVRQLCFTKR